MAYVISEVKETFSANGKLRGYTVEYRGSGDKPTENVPDGASLVDIENSKLFFYEGGSWTEFT